MCGRFTLTLLEEDLKRRFRIQKILAEFLPRYNIAPTQLIPVVIKQEAQMIMKGMRWGLIPFWAKDEKIGYKMINARVETIADKVSFKRSLQKKRCLIPADGFYEWKKERKGKTPMRIILKSEEPFAFAGLWDTWLTKEGKEIESCTVITCEANSFMKSIHHRMPVILEEKAEENWLDPNLTDSQILLKVLTPYPSNRLSAYPVSNLVNNPRADVKQCIAPVKD